MRRVSALCRPQIEPPACAKVPWQRTVVRIQRCPPGIYNLETFPDSPSALYGIVVGNSDVTGIEISLPVLVKVNGGIEWADSQGRSTSGPAERVVQFTRKEGSRMLAWGALAHSGSFHFYLPEGDYRFSVSDVPQSSTWIRLLPATPTSWNPAFA